MLITTDQRVRPLDAWKECDDCIIHTTAVQPVARCKPDELETTYSHEHSCASFSFKGIRGTETKALPHDV